MLRATSEMAVARSVRSVLEKPSPAPIVRASWRAVTTSASVRIATRISWATGVRLPIELLLEEGQPLFEVECRDGHDDPARPEAADLLHHVVLQAQHVGVRERRLDRRDQERALLEDRDRHGPRSAHLELGGLGGARHLVAEQPLG